LKLAALVAKPILKLPATLLTQELSGNIMETTKQPFADIINSDQPVLVDFFAEWCGPCKMMPPILKELKDSMGDQVRIIKVDVAKNQYLAYQYQVQGVPTLMIFKKGEIKWRQSGVVSAKQLQAILQQYI
jgi:thioredoxin 1